MKQEIEIPHGYEFSHVASQTLEIGGGEINVILKRKEVKDFNWYVDQYLSTSSGSTVDQIYNWIGDSSLSLLGHNLKTNKFSMVPWEIKIGLFKFICDDLGLNWLHQIFGADRSVRLRIIPTELIVDLKQNKP